MLDANTPARPTGPPPDVSGMFNPNPREPQPNRELMTALASLLAEAPEPKRAVQTTRRIPGVNLRGPVVPRGEDIDEPFGLTGEQFRRVLQVLLARDADRKRELLELRGRHDALEARLADLQRGGPA